MRLMNSRFKGRCVHCGTSFLAGASIYYGDKKAVHESCYPDYKPMPTAPTTEENMKKFYPNPSSGRTCVFCDDAIPLGYPMTHNRSYSGQYAHEQCFMNAGEKFPPVPVSTLEDHPYFDTPKPAVETTFIPSSTPASGLEAMIAMAIMPQVETRLKPIIDKLQNVDTQAIEALIHKLVSERVSIPVEIKQQDRPSVTIESAHKKFQQLAHLLAMRKHVWLYGPAGAGKTTAVKQFSEAVALRYGYIALTPQTTDSRVNGFIDANGVFRDTVFFQCYTQGGVFAIEEVANASGNVLTALNAALENGHASFPDGIHERHPDFVLVALDNTAGRGASMQYNNRHKIDDSFLDRFYHLYWPIDEVIENSVAMGINPNCAKWVGWIQNVRAYAAVHYQQFLVSPRASYRIASMLDAVPSIFTVDEMLDASLFKGIDKETKAKILAQIPAPVFK